MSLSPHRLPPEVLAALAAGGGGEEPVRLLAAAQESKHRLLVLGVAELSASAGHPGAAAAGRSYDLLAGIEKRAPDTVRQVIRYPAVGAWAARTLRGLRSGADGGDPAQLGAVAAAAASLAGIACQVEVPARDGWTMLPSVGRLALPDSRSPGSTTPGSTTADRTTAGDTMVGRAPIGVGRTSPGLTETARTGPVVAEPLLMGVQVAADGTVRADGSPVELERLHRLTTGDGALSLLVDDLDPYRWDAGKAADGRLTAAERDLWRRCLDDAWRMLAEHHWTIAAECRAAVTVLTPIKGPARGMDSASSPDLFGTLALSAPPDGRWLAATFAHEVQHAKLGAIMDLVALTRPDAGRYYAPWRPDPRPLAGLLQGAYAYLGVTGFWRRQREHEPDLRPHIEFARWREQAYEATGTLLAGDGLTEEGRRFVQTMRATMEPWLTEPVPAEALEAARAESAAHRARWERDNRNN
jgi:uncharacterized protein